MSWQHAWMGGLVLAMACGAEDAPTATSPEAFCRFPTFERAASPLKTTDEGQCDAALAAAFDGDCENFHWAGLMGDPTVVYDGSRFRMWYSAGERSAGPGGEPLWEAGIAVAESADGLLWDDPKDLVSDVVPVLRPGTPGVDETGMETPFVMVHEGEHRMYFTGDRSVAPSSIHVIGRAVSADGDTWAKDPDPTLTATLPWEEPFDAGGFEVGGVLEPSVMFDEGVFKMWYQGFGQVDGEIGYARFGYAESTDGVTWDKRAEPIFTGKEGTFEALGVGHTNVVKDPDGGFHLFYVGIGLDERLRLGHAYSDDGIVWERNPNNPILEGVDGAYDEGVVGGPSALFVEGELLLYTMGNASPDFSTPTHFARTKGVCE